MEEEKENKNENFNMMIPGAIMVAGVIIAGAVIYSSGSIPSTPAADRGQAAAPSGAIENIKPVTGDDHIRGSIDAPVIIVEFSDLECPFCKRFHATMQQIVDSYDGQVSWVYRHLPLPSIHSKAVAEAEATECAAALGGNDAFWAYIDRIFEVTPSNNGLDLDHLPQIAESVGLDAVKFQECFDERRYKDAVQADLEDAANSGGRGTPYSIVIAANGTKSVIPGAFPYESVKEIVDAALEN